MLLAVSSCVSLLPSTSRVPLKIKKVHSEEFLITKSLYLWNFTTRTHTKKWGKNHKSPFQDVLMCCIWLFLIFSQAYGWNKEREMLKGLLFEHLVCQTSRQVSKIRPVHTFYTIQLSCPVVWKFSLLLAAGFCCAFLLQTMPVDKPRIRKVEREQCLWTKSPDKSENRWTGTQFFCTSNC